MVKIYFATSPGSQVKSVVLREIGATNQLVSFAYLSKLKDPEWLKKYAAEGLDPKVEVQGEFDFTKIINKMKIRKSKRDPARPRKIGLIKRLEAYDRGEGDE